MFLGEMPCARFQLFECAGYFMYLINRFALQCRNWWECEQEVHNQHIWSFQEAYNAVCSIVFNLWCIFVRVCPEELHHYSSCFFTVTKIRDTQVKPKHSKIARENIAIVKNVCPNLIKKQRIQRCSILQINYMYTIPLPVLCQGIKKQSVKMSGLLSINFPHL